MNLRDGLTSLPPLDLWTLSAASAALAATVVTVAALALCRMLRGRSVPLRHGILCAAIGVVLLTVPAGVASRHLGLSLLRIAPASPGPTTLEAPLAITVPAPVDPIDRMTERQPGHHDPAAPAPAHARVTGTPTVIWPTWRMLATACCLAWVAGTLVGGLLLVRDAAALWRFTRSFRPCPDRTAGRLLRRAARSVGLTRPPRLCESPAAAVPLVMGPLVPVVVLPADLSQRLSAEQLSAILVHEMAHVVHGDLWIGVLQRLAAILFWWCPPVHAVNRRLADARELICDNHVLRSGGDGCALAEALVDLASGIPGGGRRLAAVALGAVDERWGLASRVERLVRLDGRDTATRLSGASLVAVCGFALGSLSLVAATAIRAAEAPAVDLAAHAPTEIEAIDAALEWIAGQQDDDGGWTLTDGTDWVDDRVAATSLAILPFLGRGHSHRDGPYQEQLAKGIAFLADQVTKGKGGVVGGRATMYTQGLATMTLCRAFAATEDKSLMAPAQAAIDFIQSAQDPVGGGWSYQPRRSGGDTSIFGWQLMALKSGHMASLPINPEKIKKAAGFLDIVQADDGACYGYTEPGQGPATSAVGLLCRMYLGWKKDRPALQRGVERLAKMGPSQDLYFDYYATQIMKLMEGDIWLAWNEKMKTMLLSTQATKGPEAGSWSEGWNTIAVTDRLYTTSLATMILETSLAPQPGVNK